VISIFLKEDGPNVFLFPVGQSRILLGWEPSKGHFRSSKSERFAAIRLILTDVSSL
jgi:hypothetical protein